MIGTLNGKLKDIKEKTDNLPNDPADQSLINAELVLIKAKTDNLPTDPADQSLINDQLLLIKAKTDTIPASFVDQDDIDALHAVPGIDSATNLLMRDVIGNKSDSHSGSSLFGKIKQILDHVHSTIFTFPNLADSTVLTKPAGGWAGGYGVIVEIIPANSVNAEFDLHYMSVSNISANGQFQIQLYSGAGGAEVAEGNGFAISRTAVQSQEGTRPIMTRLFPANTRISAAIVGNGGAMTVSMKLEGHKY